MKIIMVAALKLSTLKIVTASSWKLLKLLNAKKKVKLEMVTGGLESCAAAPYDRERTKSSFSQFAELVSLFHCSGEAGEDLQQDTLEIKGKDAHPGRQET